MRTMPDNSVDAIVTDPPYGLSFMGKKWDYDVPSVEVWEECLRVLKPGGHLLAFAGTRTQHRMAVRIEDAGFEIRDMIAWVYGSGFPKSHNVGKAIDKAAGAEREVVGQYEVTRDLSGGSWADLHGKPNAATLHNITAPATPDAERWQGWGTALKPALEPITVARKPFSGTVAANVLEHGTGAINVDGCRVDGVPPSVPQPIFSAEKVAGFGASNGRNGAMSQATGRWPANLIHDGSEEVVGIFPASSVTGKRTDRSRSAIVDGTSWLNDNHQSTEYTDTGSAARFFYCAKASKADRDEGLGAFDTRETAAMAGNMVGGQRLGGDGSPIATPTRANHHPTVKPTALMRYLCRLVTPPGGTVLDPFMGSGSTGKAAKLEGFNFIGIEREAEYVTIAQARIDGAKMDAKPKAAPTLFD